MKNAFEAGFWRLSRRVAMFAAVIAAIVAVSLFSPSAAQAQHCGGFGGFQGQSFGGQFIPQSTAGQIIQLPNGQLVQVLANGQIIPLTNPTFAAQGFIGFGAAPVHVNQFGQPVVTRTVQRQGLFGRTVTTTRTFRN